MNWKNLINSRCPKCNSWLLEKGVMLGCSNCDFLIRQSRIKEILENKPRQGIKYRPISEEENLEMLNNEGYNEIVDDFSNTP